MPVRTVNIYEVPNSYVGSGGTVTISNILTMQVKDGDGFLDATESADPGSSQIITVDGNGIDDYRFYYDDRIRIDGHNETVKTFQLQIDGVWRSFIMNDTGGSIPGADIGDSISLRSYSNYTKIDYDDLACFAVGTLIETDRGQVAVEELQVGDLVVTADHGLQPIRWIGRSPLTQRDLLARPHLRPIRIPSGSFGGGIPSRDLVLSPQHRVLLEGWQIELNFGTRQVFAPANALVGSNGIKVDATCEDIEYLHLMFDQHEVIYSEGLASESFLVGDTIRNNMDRAQLAEILELFPELADNRISSVNIPARPILRNYEVQVLAASA
ncbi:MAG: Hint domain-containing protein [Rhodobacteraceae bacterium]|nr:Hint domain-containing protein [Paracoccaceae bacterium]